MGLKAILAVMALVHIGFGLWGLTAPAAVASMLELQPLTAGALGEVRAVYGGLILALGVVLARGALGGAGARPWLAVAGLSYAGLATGRVMSLLADGASGYTLLALGLESLIAAFLGWVSMQAGRAPIATAGSGVDPAA